MLKSSLKRLIPVTAVAALLISCAASTPDQVNYVDSYLEAVQTSQGQAISLDEAQLRFHTLFKDLKQENLSDTILSTYAETFYFNDTFRTIADREGLLEYLLETSENVESTMVRVDDIARSGNDYYLRWVMEFEVDVSGKKVSSTSIGMTHVRFDSNGRIILHQDYWDSANGFYQHLPFIGLLIRRVQSSL